MPETTPRQPIPAEHPKPVMRGSVAGTLLISAILVGMAIGVGIGALVGAIVPLGLLGLFAGLGAGFALVYSRFKDL
jgi:F0F1-type ATP synthase assembly protein I